MPQKSDRHQLIQNASKKKMTVFIFAGTHVCIKGFFSWPLLFQRTSAVVAFLAVTFSPLRIFS